VQNSVVSKGKNVIVSKCFFVLHCIVTFFNTIDANTLAVLSRLTQNNTDCALYQKSDRKRSVSSGWVRQKPRSILQFVNICSKNSNIFRNPKISLTCDSVKWAKLLFMLHHFWLRIQNM
jgi:hypothetical protein